MRLQDSQCQWIVTWLQQKHVRGVRDIQRIRFVIDALVFTVVRPMLNSFEYSAARGKSSSRVPLVV